jgi:hypothetical protein
MGACFAKQTSTTLVSTNEPGISTSADKSFENGDDGGDRVALSQPSPSSSSYTTVVCPACKQRPAEYRCQYHEADPAAVDKTSKAPKAHLWLSKYWLDVSGWTLRYVSCNECLPEVQRRYFHHVTDGWKESTKYPRTYETFADDGDVNKGAVANRA